MLNKHSIAGYCFLSLLQIRCLLDPNTKTLKGHTDLFEVRGTRYVGTRRFRERAAQGKELATST